MADDTDPRIAYDTSSCEFDGLMFVNYGILGDPYPETMRGTKSAKTSFTFALKSSKADVDSMQNLFSQIPRLSTDTGFCRDKIIPKFSCEDGNDFVPFANYAIVHKYYTTNVPLCKRANLSAGIHTLTTQITADNPNQTVFWLDTIE
ncbi:hypothetical protein AAF712_015595 [Marasmius tenuissimus]|uniref:Uncharacterized protein n=1 Tax=Marasmius tenuissimus TaxID=585030 RepID=A0ABR2Z8Z7_9AGAR